MNGYGLREETARLKYRALRHSLSAGLALSFVAGTAGAQSSTNAAGAAALSESGSTTLEIPQLEDAKDPAAARPVDTDTEKKPVRDEVPAGSGRRNAGLVIGGAGVVALGVGVFFGLRAFSKWSDRNDHCVGGCDSAAKSAGDDAKIAATISSIGLGLGVVAVGVGTYLVLSSKSASDPSASYGRGSREARAWQVVPSAGPTGGGLVLQGVF